ncbi:CAT RNA binding domain-containing protein [Collinsella stercoris]|uniref:CAT RNA binding domain-containing protein n=1 Tax=Collinsella stercoris TaxID=147206 RepID=UPI003AF19C32
MEIAKRINTSAVLCIDGNGRQLVAFGRGLGFKDVGDELRVIGQKVCPTSGRLRRQAAFFRGFKTRAGL